MPYHASFVFEIGTTLREARRRRNLDISQCEAATRIRARYLQALEEGHLDLIPAPVYVRSFLRTYAEFLEIDATPLLEEYAYRHERRGPAGEEAAYHRVRQIRPRRFRPHMPGGQLTWLALGGMLSVGVLVWVGAGNGGPTAVPLPPVTATPATRPPAAPVPVSPAPSTAPGRRGVDLVLSARDEGGSYVEVRQGSAEGPTVWVGTIVPGVSRRFRDPRALWIRAGWTPGLAARVNGRIVRLGGGTADFTVTSRGIRSAAR